MKLNYTLDTFTRDAWEQTFGAFVKANRSHWRGAPYDAVMTLLRTKGRFEFTVQSMGTWTCRLVLTILDDSHLDAEFVPNSALSGRMQEHLRKMQESFEKELRASGIGNP